VSVDVQGPAGLPANAPVEEVEVSDTVRGPVAPSARPSVCSWSVRGPAGLPAVAAVGVVRKPGRVGAQAENACQVAGSVAPGRTVVHQLGRHAAAPGSIAGTPESRIAAATRSRSSPVCALKAVVVRPSELLGDQANPMRSLLAPVATASVRSASTWPETKSSISSSGAAVQP
jgi:hypothetical protein